MVVEGKKHAGQTFLTLTANNSKSGLSLKSPEPAGDKEANIVKNANDTLKRLQLTLFRNFQDTRILRDKTHAKLNSPSESMVNHMMQSGNKIRPYMTLSHDGPSFSHH
jgi:hypothetical protein